MSFVWDSDCPFVAGYSLTVDTEHSGHLVQGTWLRVPDAEEHAEHLTQSVQSAHSKHPSVFIVFCCRVFVYISAC